MAFIIIESQVYFIGESFPFRVLVFGNDYHRQILSQTDHIVIDGFLFGTEIVVRLNQGRFVHLLCGKRIYWSLRARNAHEQKSTN